MSSSKLADIRKKVEHGDRLSLDDGLLLPDTLVPDLPTNYGGFSPENFDHEYRGAVPAHQALSQSLNIPAVRMLRQYGLGRFHSQLQRMGMSTLFRSAEEYGLTLVLGGAEGTLDELTGIYARLFASAMRAPSYPVATLQPLLAGRESARPVLSPGAAWLTLDALRDVARPGTARQWRLFSSSQPIAERRVKTSLVSIPGFGSGGYGLVSSSIVTVYFSIAFPAAFQPLKPGARSTVYLNPISLIFLQARALRTPPAQ